MPSVINQRHTHFEESTYSFWFGIILEFVFFPFPLYGSLVSPTSFSGRITLVGAKFRDYLCKYSSYFLTHGNSRTIYSLYCVAIALSSTYVFFHTRLFLHPSTVDLNLQPHFNLVLFVNFGFFIKDKPSELRNGPLFQFSILSYQ